MAEERAKALVTTDWLEGHLSAPDVRVVDASWYHPKLGRNARQEWAEAHIPDAVFFDIDDVAADDTGLPHMVPSAEKFSSRMRKLGLGAGHHIVIYDRAGSAGAAARVWWTFRLFGHHDVSVLDGGLPKWIAEGRPIEDMPPAPRERHFVSRMDMTLLRTVDQMKANIASRREQVVDARSPGRFLGREPEPWPGFKVGHIPGSLNLPYTDLLDPHSQTLLPVPELTRRFGKAGLDLGKPIVTTCGSGVTACVLALALHLAGARQVAVYDGSWAEWGNRDDTPVEA